ncbi:MAG: type II toxin-antitoxin system HicB family antitoxin [Pyramidobacter sp.]|jgi:predicted RNase H-like HicB family nuclease
MRAVYPVIFTPVEGAVLVEAPDLEVLTQGKDLSDAVEMARDAISLKCVDLEDEGEPIPEPTALKKIDVAKGEFAQASSSFASLVDIDTRAYRRMIDNKSVRRTVTLPNWLDYAAEKGKINVSKLLQDALVKELGCAKR